MSALRSFLAGLGLGTGAAYAISRWAIPQGERRRPSRRQKRIDAVVDRVARRSDGPAPVPVLPSLPEEEVETEILWWGERKERAA